MRLKTPALIATAGVVVFGLLVLSAVGGVEAVLGPSLAALVATIFVLLR